MSSSLKRSRSLFGGSERPPDGYMGRGDSMKKVASAMDDDEEGLEHDPTRMGEHPEGVSPPPQEGPFSALTPSMWPNVMKQVKKKTSVIPCMHSRSKTYKGKTID